MMLARARLSRVLLSWNFGLRSRAFARRFGRRLQRWFASSMLEGGDTAWPSHGSLFAPMHRSAGVLLVAMFCWGRPCRADPVPGVPTPQTSAPAPEGDEVSLGKYVVEGIVPGEYQVSVMAVPELKIVGPNDPEAKRKLSDAEIQAMIDPLPADTKGKEQALAVKGGKQKLDFKLESKSKR